VDVERSDQRAYLGCGHHTADTFDYMKQKAGKRGGSGNFIVEYMRPFFADDFITRVRNRLEANLITHCAGRHKQGCFPAKHLRGYFLQPHYGWVIIKNIIPHLGIGYRPTHLLGRLGNCIRPQIEISHFAFRSFKRIASRERSVIRERASRKNAIAVV
jgi:hypothetical protein